MKKTQGEDDTRGTTDDQITYNWQKEEEYLAFTRDDIGQIHGQLHVKYVDA